MVERDPVLEVQSSSRFVKAVDGDVGEGAPGVAEDHDRARVGVRAEVIVVLRWLG